MGCPIIHVSTAALTLTQKIPAGPGFQVPFAQVIHQQVQIPTIAVGLISEPLQAKTILASHQANAIAIGRAIMHNPH